MTGVQTCALPICLVFGSVQALADTRVFELRDADPEALLPVVKPLLGPWENVSAYRQSLVVNASPETLERIGTLLGELDRPPRTLLVRLRRASSDRAPADDAISTRPREDMQQARVLEGRPLVLHRGSLMPLPAGGALGPDILWRELESGMAVSVRVSGEDVTMDIDLRDEEALREGRQLTLRTTVRGRVGEWIPLGAGPGGASTEPGTQSTRDRTEEMWEAQVELAP